IVSSNLTIWSLVASPVWMVTFPIAAGVVLLLLPQLASSNTRATLVRTSRKVRFIGPPVTKMYAGKWQIEEWLDQGYYAGAVNRCKRFVSLSFLLYMAKETM